MIEKKRLVCTFSGGETSAYMAQWVKKNKSEEYEIVFIFANTGQENEETLDFVKKCDEYFQLGIVWVEAVFDMRHGKGTRHKIVDFNTASRNGEPYYQGIKKHGMPNTQNPWCTRDLKLYAIQSYLKRELGWKKGSYYTAIGIRQDEIDRVNAKYKEEKLYYPLVSDRPMTKPKINFWWKNQPFRLNLKGYEGNCMWCFKKSLKKLMTIAVEKPHYFDFPKRVEKEFENWVPDSRAHNTNIKFPIRFFRSEWSVQDIFENSKKPFTKAKDDSDVYVWQTSMFDVDLDSTNGCEESCEVY